MRWRCGRWRGGRTRFSKCARIWSGGRRKRRRRGTCSRGCASRRLLDDARYAAEFARLRARTRSQGRYRITRELRARGVSDQHIEAAVAQAFAETDEAALLRKTIERRIRSLRGPLDARRAASLYGSLLRAGFDAGLIRRELQAAARGGAAKTADWQEGFSGQEFE